jgi:hypothetical protein
MPKHQMNEVFGATPKTAGETPALPKPPSQKL